MVKVNELKRKHNIVWDRDSNHYVGGDGDDDGAEKEEGGGAWKNCAE